LSKFKVIYTDNKALYYKRRTIIRVFIDGKPQLFYRSTGENSHYPGRFLPFDGIVMSGPVCLWFNKHRFTHNPEKPNTYHGFGELHRFGTSEMKAISDELTKINIPQGVSVPEEHGERINRFTKLPIEYPLTYLLVDKC
jgi:hypothetical protein